MISSRCIFYDSASQMPNLPFITRHSVVFKRSLKSEFTAFGIRRSDCEALRGRLERFLSREQRAADAIQRACIALTFTDVL